MAKFLTLNINGIRNKGLILADYLQSSDVDFALIQETKLKGTQRNPYIPGYTVAARRDNTLDPDDIACGGTMVLVKLGLATTPLDTSSIDNNCAAISIDLPTVGKIAVVSMYVPPYRTSNIHTFSFSYFFQNFSKVIIMGDFNAYHPCIDDVTIASNNRGDQLHTIINRFPFQIQNSNGAPTRLHHSTGSQSLLDLIITTNNLTSFISHIFVGDDVGSDHLPVHLHLADASRIHQEVRLTRNLKKANWDHFKELTKEKVDSLRHLEDNPPLSISDVDSVAAAVSEALTSALDTVAPLKPIK
ncbi:MAG: endonuclease/exonuclease/phosphatase family protein, partial [Cyanobacteria bacterium J06638_20]